MTNMIHEDAKFKNILTDEEHNPIGFTLSGTTYANVQLERGKKGIEIQIVMKSSIEFKKLIEQLNDIKMLL